MAGIGISIAGNGPAEDFEPAEYTLQEKVLIERLVRIRPHIEKGVSHPDMAASLRETFAHSMLPSLMDAGLSLDNMSNEDFELALFDFRPAVMQGVLEDTDLATVLAWGNERSTEFLMVWAAWQREESYELFRVEYQVKNLSKHTRPRWDNFQDAWGEVTRDARRAYFTEFLTEAEGDSPLSLEWQLTFITTNWNRQVEVPWVTSNAVAGSDSEKAVPTGASGKAISL